MNIEYAEITIIRNIEEEWMFNPLYRYFGYENTTNNNDTIIISFDDGTICDTKDEYIDKKFEFGQLGDIYKFPIYFDTDKGIHLFYKNPIIKNDIPTVNSTIFKNYYKFKNQQYKNKICKFNFVYEDINKNHVFAIRRIQSNKDKPRFLLAYDDTIFDKTDIIYLVNYLFKSNTY